MKKTVKQVRENVRQFDSRGEKYYVHMITFKDDPADYSYNAKTAACTKFVPDQEVDVEIGVDNLGNPKVKPVSNFQQGGQQQSTGGNKGGYKYEPKDQGAINALSVYGSTCQRLQGSSEAKNMTFVLEQCEAALEWIKSKSDNK